VTGPLSGSLMVLFLSAYGFVSFIPVYWSFPASMMCVPRPAPALDLTRCGDVEPNPGPYHACDSPSWLVTDDRGKAEEWARIMNGDKSSRQEALDLYSEFFRGKSLRTNGRVEPFLVDMVKDGMDLKHSCDTITLMDDHRNSAQSSPYVPRDPKVKMAFAHEEQKNLGHADAIREKQKQAEENILGERDGGPESRLRAYMARGPLVWETTRDPYVIHVGNGPASWTGYLAWSVLWSVLFFVLAVFFGPIGAVIFFITIRSCLIHWMSDEVRHWRVEILGDAGDKAEEDRPAAMSHQKITRRADYARVAFSHRRVRGWYHWDSTTRIEEVPLGVVAEVQNSVGYIVDTTKFERYEVRIAQCFNVGLQASRLKDYHGPSLKMLVALAMDEKMRRTSSDDLLDFHVGPTRRVGPATQC